MAPLMVIGVPPGGVAAEKRVADLDLSLGDIERAVTIVKHDNHMTQEYRVNNNLYMIKITPDVGKPLYLVDPDGSGEMQWRRNAAGMDVHAPQWALFGW